MQIRGEPGGVRQPKRPAKKGFDTASSEDAAPRVEKGDDRGPL